MKNFIPSLSGAVFLSLILLTIACRSTPDESVSALAPTANPTTQPDPTAAPRPTPSPQPTVMTLTAEQRSAIFNRVWTAVSDNYPYPDYRGVDWDAVGDTYRPLVEEEQADDAFHALMREFVGELGSESTYFMTPEDVAQAEAFDAGDGGFVGIGVFFSETDEGLKVLATVAGGPAREAGLKPGDLIVAIEGTPVTDLEPWGPQSYTSLVLGEPGTSVALSIKPPDEDRFDIAITREQIEFSNLVPIESRLIDETQVGMVIVHTFAPNDIADVLEDTLLDLTADPDLSGLIIDLRTNSGGSLDGMKKSLGLFVNGGIVGREGNVPIVVPANRTLPPIDDLPLVVLIGPDTAGTAEIFAIGLQLLRDAPVVGTPSAGNTEIAGLHRLPGGSRLILAHSVYEMPDGTLIEGIGIEPDHQVETDWSRYLTAEDPLIKKAVELLR